MARLKLTSQHKNALPVVIRDQNLDEVWRGILKDKHELELPSGHYLIDVNGLEGRKQLSFKCEGKEQSIAIGGDKTAQAEEYTNDDLDKESSNKDTQESNAISNKIDSVIANIEAEGVMTLEKVSVNNARRSLQRASVIRTAKSSSDHNQLNVRVGSRLGAFSHESVRVGATPTRGSRRNRNKNTQSIALWSKAPDASWQLNTAPELEQILGESAAQRFLRISGHDRLPILVSMPNQVESISISMDPRRASNVLINEQDTNVMALRAMIERHEYREAALMAANLAKTGGVDLPGAAQVALVLSSLLAELNETERPKLDWFKKLAFSSSQLADPLVAYAWYGTYLDLLDEEEIAQALLKSVECGVPRLTMTLQLLHRGLELLSYEGAEAAIFDAREIVRNWVDHMQPDTFFTTFIGSGRHILMNINTNSRPVQTGSLVGVSIESLNVRQEDGFLIIRQ